MSTNDSNCSTLGLFERLPPEIRDSIWSFYFAPAASTIKMVPSGRDGHGKDRYYLQPYDRDLLSVSRAVRQEASPFHRPPKLGHNHPALRPGSIKRVGWEIPARTHSKTTTIIANIDSIKPPGYLPDLQVDGAYRYGQGLELRLNIADFEITHWAKSNQLPEPLPAQAWQEVHHGIVRVFKDWVWRCPWSYTYGPEPPVVYSREDPLFCPLHGRNEISAEIECWRTPPFLQNGSKVMLKSLVCSSSLVKHRLR